jgi:predicted amidohydrolase
MRVAIAQLNQRVGDLAGNTRALSASIGEARAAGAAVLVTPELSICGYPPEDLPLRTDFLEACAAALRDLAAQARGLVVLAGFPECSEGRRYNAVAVLRDGAVAHVYRKQCLPNATVFDEARTFTPGTEPCVFSVDGRRCGVIVCEDIWTPGPARQSRDAGAEVLLVSNASPYHTRQRPLRPLLMNRSAPRSNTPCKLGISASPAFFIDSKLAAWTSDAITLSGTLISRTPAIRCISPARSSFRSL